ncbi:MAG: hypothetical protein ACRCUF_12310 [Aeromonas sobria]
MKQFFREVSKMVFALLWLLALSTALNWKVNMDRITEYKALSAKMDAMAEYLAVEYADVLAMPADVE